MNWLYWFLCFLTGAIPAFLIYGKDRRRRIPVTWLPALLRFSAFFCTAVLLLAPAFPSHKTREEKPVLLWLQDNSLSVRYALGKDSASYREKTEALWAKWKKKYDVVPIAFGNRLQKDSFFRYAQAGTNISAALQYAGDQYEDRNIGAVIISSDGVFNEGLNPLFAKYKQTAPVYTIGLGDSTMPKDAFLSGVYANKTVPLHNKFELIADLRALKLRGAQAVLSVIHKGKTINRVPLSINSDFFTRSFRFQLLPSEKGFQRYTIVLDRVGDEHNLHNNRMDIFVDVVDRELRVLILAAAPHPDIAAIQAALARTDYKVSIKYGNDMPADFNDYALIIAHQVPAVQGARFAAPADMPVWYILGSRSDMNAFNQVQSVLKVTPAGGGNDVLAQFEPGFPYFSLPPDIREVVPRLPPLKAPSGQYQSGSDAGVLFRQQIGNVASGYPLWLVRTGTHPEAVLCGTGIWRWRMYENKYFKKQETVDDLIRKTVSLLSIKKNEQPFRVFLNKYVFGDKEPVGFYAELRNENQELINMPEARLQLQDSAGNTLDYVFERAGTGYQAQAGVLAAGDYRFTGSVDFRKKHYESRGAFRVNAVPLELMRSYADFGLLYQLAHEHKGAFYTPAHFSRLEQAIADDESIRPVLHSEMTYIQWIDRKWFFFLILFFAVAEWLLRKYWSL